MKYLVKTRLDHDGQTFWEGDVVELEDRVAQPLLAVEAVEPIEEDRTAKSKKDKKTSEEGDAGAPPTSPGTEGA